MLLIKPSANDDALPTRDEAVPAPSPSSFSLIFYFSPLDQIVLLDEE